MNNQLNAEKVLAQPKLWASPELPFLPFGTASNQLCQYLDLLSVWGSKINLTASQDHIYLMRDLVQDSFFLTRFIEDRFSARGWEEPIICDLGAGAGLPGIPFRIFWQKGSFTLVERRQKRALFLQNACSRLKLPKTTVLAGDAKDYLARQAQRKQDCILSRAFMPWPDLLSLCHDALSAAGFLVIMANEAPPEGLDKGWQLEAELQYKLPHKTRWLWAVRRSNAAGVN